MKKILVILTAMLSFAANAQEYYKDGVIWIMQNVAYGTTEAPVYWDSFLQIKKCQDNGADALGMYYKSDELSDSEFKCYVKTEGKKVYFKLPESTGSNWYLMYDFGMKLGEGEYFYSPLFTELQSDTPDKTYLLCKETVYNEGIGWDTMIFDEFMSEEDREPYGFGEVTWLTGLCGYKGVLRNIGSGLSGDGGSVIKEVRDGDKVVFKNKSIHTPETTGVDEIGLGQNTDSPVSVRQEGNSLYVTASAPVLAALYDSEGKVVSSLTAGTEPAHIALPGQGIYILRAGDFTKKLISR